MDAITINLADTEDDAVYQHSILSYCDTLKTITLYYKRRDQIIQFIDWFVGNDIGMKCTKLSNIRIRLISDPRLFREHVQQDSEEFGRLVRNCDDRLTEFTITGVRITDMSALLSALQTCTNLIAFSFQLTYTEGQTELIRSSYILAGRRGLSSQLENWRAADDNARVIHQLADKLHYFTKLQRLELSGCTIGVAEATALAQELPQCEVLKTLNIINSMSDEAASILAAILPTLKELEVLDFSRNRIGVGGAIAIAEVLRFCIKLRNLNLSYSEFGDAGALIFADGLRNIARPLTVDFLFVEITTAGITALLDVMEANSNINIGKIIYGDDELRLVSETRLANLRGNRDDRREIEALQEWTPETHENFGEEVNRLFVTFLAGMFMMYNINNDVFPMCVLQTLESYVRQFLLETDRANLNWVREVTQIATQIVGEKANIPLMNVTYDDVENEIATPPGKRLRLISPPKEKPRKFCVHGDHITEEEEVLATCQCFYCDSFYFCDKHGEQHSNAAYSNGTHYMIPI